MIELTSPYFRKPKPWHFEWSSLTDAELKSEVDYLQQLARKYGRCVGVATTLEAVPDVIYDALSAATHEARRRAANAG